MDIRRGKKRPMLNPQRPMLNSEFIWDASTSESFIARRSTAFRQLHKLDGRAIWITNVNDALSGVGTGLKSLRFTSSLPAGRVNRAQNCVEIMNDERHVHEANIAGAKIDVRFTLQRREVLQQFDLVTARCLHDRKLDLGTFDSSDFTGHFASLMRGM